MLNSLELHIQSKLSSLGYSSTCLIAIRKINIRLNINNANDLESSTGLDYIAGKWVEAIAAGFMRILSSIGHDVTKNQPVYNDLLAIFPDRTSAEIVYLEHLAGNSRLPWWVTPLLSENNVISSAQAIIHKWLIKDFCMAVISLQELTERAGTRWLNLLKTEELLSLLAKLVVLDDSSSFIAIENTEKTSSSHSATTVPNTHLQFSTKEKSLLKKLHSIEQLIFLGAIFVSLRLEKFAPLITLKELLSILLFNIHGLKTDFPEFHADLLKNKQQKKQKKQQPSNRQEFNKPPHESVEKYNKPSKSDIESGLDAKAIEQQRSNKQEFNEPPYESVEKYNKPSKSDIESSLDAKAIKQQQNELAVEKNKPGEQTTLAHNNSNQTELFEFTKEIKDHSETTSKRPAHTTDEYQTESTLTEYACPVGCGGLLFLIRNSAKLLPDPAQTEANAQIMKTIAIMALQDLLSMLPEAGQRAAWKREAPLIQAFAGLNESPDRFDLNDIVPENHYEAKTILEKLSLQISGKVRPGQNGIAYFFGGEAPSQLTPLQNMLLRPGRLQVDNVYITLQMPLSDIDIAASKTRLGY